MFSIFVSLMLTLLPVFACTLILGISQTMIEELLYGIFGLLFEMLTVFLYTYRHFYRHRIDSFKPYIIPYCAAFAVRFVLSLVTHDYPVVAGFSVNGFGLFLYMLFTGEITAGTALEIFPSSYFIAPCFVVGAVLLPVCYLSYRRAKRKHEAERQALHQSDG